MTKIQKNYIQTLQRIAKCGLALPWLILWTSLYNITKIITSRCSHGKSWNSPSSIKRGRGISLQSIYKKGEFKFSHKKGTVGKIRGVILKRGGYRFFILTLSSVTFLSVWRVCLVYLHLFYQNSLCFTGRT